jgi:prevent-host-death family protein
MHTIWQIFAPQNVPVWPSTGSDDQGMMTMIERVIFPMKTMAAGAFKVHCPKVMDEVQSKRQAVLITKRGEPVAKLVPVEKETDDIYVFSLVRAGSSATSSHPHSLWKSGAIWS